MRALEVNTVGAVFTSSRLIFRPLTDPAIVTESVAPGLK